MNTLTDLMWYIFAYNMMMMTSFRILVDFWFSLASFIDHYTKASTSPWLESRVELWFPTERKRNIAKIVKLQKTPNELFKAIF